MGIRSYFKETLEYYDNKGKFVEEGKLWKSDVRECWLDLIMFAVGIITMSSVLICDNAKFRMVLLFMGGVWIGGAILSMWWYYKGRGTV